MDRSQVIIIKGVMAFLAGVVSVRIAQAQDAIPTLDQILKSKYTPGMQLTVAAPGILIVNLKCKVPIVQSVFKDGQIHGPNFAVKQSLRLPGCLSKTLDPNSTVYLATASVGSATGKTNHIEFTVFDVYDFTNANGFRAQVDVELPKDTLVPEKWDAIDAAIHQVFTGGKAAPAPPVSNPPMPTSGTSTASSSPQGGQGKISVGVTFTAKVLAAYVNSQSKADRLELNSDLTFTLLQDGKSYGGTWSGTRNSIKLHMSETNIHVDLSIQKNQLIIGDTPWIQLNPLP